MKSRVVDVGYAKSIQVNLIADSAKITIIEPGSGEGFFVAIVIIIWLVGLLILLWLDALPITWNSATRGFTRKNVRSENARKSRR
jgi:hypothetical protein